MTRKDKIFKKELKEGNNGWTVLIFQMKEQFNDQEKNKMRTNPVSQGKTEQRQTKLNMTRKTNNSHTTKPPSVT